MKMCNVCNEVGGLCCLPPSLPLNKVLVKHIKQAWMSFPILKGNDGKKLQKLKKSNSLTERGFFSAVEIYEVPFGWCTYV
jgi:hypothetical protein